MTVVTAITANRDVLRTDQNAEGAKFVAFVNSQQGHLWEIRKPCDLFCDPVRNAKIHKVLIHKYIEDDISIWMDGNVALKVPAPQIADEFLGDADMWAMTHNWRWCAYEEAIAAASRDANPSDCENTVNKYRYKGFPANWGLYECNLIIRRHNDKTDRFNEMWWGEISTGTRRDQISFAYCLWKSDLKFSTTRQNIREHPYFGYGNHG